MIDVIDEVVAPVRAAVPERPSLMEFFDPAFEVPRALADRPAGEPPLADVADGSAVAWQAEEYLRFVTGMAALGLVSDGLVTREAVGLYRALRGGFIRGVVTGVFAGRPEPLDVRFFGDEHYTTVLSKVGPEARLRSGFLSSLPGWVFDGVPDRDPGPGEEVRLDTDEGGFVPATRRPELDVIRGCAARPRLGTVLVDLAVRAAVLAEYPHGAFGLLDNDLGRYRFSATVRPDGRWSVSWAPATRADAEQWIVRAVKNHV